MSIKPINFLKDMPKTRVGLWVISVNIVLIFMVLSIIYLQAKMEVLFHADSLQYMKAGSVWWTLLNVTYVISVLSTIMSIIAYWEGERSKILRLSMIPTFLVLIFGSIFLVFISSESRSSLLSI